MVQTGRNERFVWGSVVVLLLVMISASSYAAFLRMVEQGKRDSERKGKVGWNVGSQGPPTQAVGRALVLMMGVDSVDGTSRADTLMLASVASDPPRVGVLSIPRDTRVAIPGKSHMDKVNHAYVYGGPTLAVQTVEGLVGQPIDYYVALDFKGFERVIDRLGGISLDVQKAMRYTDKAGGLEIRLDAGYQHLNGRAALGYVRFRHDAMGDIGRVARQADFLKALAKEAFRPRNFIKLPGVIREARLSVGTNLSLGQMLGLAWCLKGVKSESIVTSLLPGSPSYVDGVSYWLPDDEALRSEFARISSGDRVLTCRVDVLNGCGQTGAAQRVADRLREEGFQIGRVDNADTKGAQSTQIIDHTGDSEAISRMYEVLDPATTEYRMELMKDSDSDVVIIVGQNTKI